MFDDLYRRIDESEQDLSAFTGRLAALQGVTAQLADLAGRATAAEDKVVVEFGSTGLRELTIDPRAMRLPAADLAAAITEALAAAEADYRDQARTLFTASGVVPDGQTAQERLAEVQSRLAHAQDTFADALRDAAGRLPQRP